MQLSANNSRAVKGTLEGAHHILLIAGDRDDAAAPWHLEYIVAMVAAAMNLARAGYPRMALYGRPMWATSKSMSSVW